MLSRLLRVLLIILNAFLALTAIAGGIGLLTGAAAPPVEDLAGSPFPDYTIPGLSLLIIVGGIAAAAFLALHCHSLAPPASAAAGAVILIFEFVEVLVIGSPSGVARNLQVFYSALGFLILALSVAWWMAGRRATSKP